jgi:ABC-type transporter Mla MlaB component
MFAAEIRWLASGPMLKMKGTLDRDWAAQARSLVTKGVIPAGLIVDLTEVSYIDTAGEDLLKWLASMGAEFAADNIYAVNVCERLHLPLLENMTAGQAAAAKVRARRPHERFR